MEDKFALPITIIAIGIILGGGIWYSRSDFNVQEPVDANVEEERRVVKIRPVSEEDHILGNPAADVVIIEYSDFECPFCQAFHPTMSRIMSEYGPKGKVAWVYRHFPLKDKHPNAMNAALASECAADIGGNEKFWEFTSLVFQNVPDSLSPEGLKATAVSIDIDADRYDSCILLNKGKNRVEQDLRDGIEIYKNDPNFGTPYSIIISKSGTQIQMIGARDYEVVKGIIEDLL